MECFMKGSELSHFKQITYIIHLYRKERYRKVDLP